MHVRPEPQEIVGRQAVRPVGLSGLMAAAWAIFIKDLRSELRTRYALNALVLFAASAAVAVSLGVGFIGLRRSDEYLLIQSALLWIALLFAALNGLSRGFVYEEETRTMAALRLAAPPIAVYLGKLLFNLALLVLLGAVTSLLFIVLVRIEVGSPLAFTLVLSAGGLCLATATTILAAIIARASFKSALFAVLAFPLLVPPLIVAIQATALTLDSAGMALAMPAIGTLVAYAVATFVASLMLFRFVWEA
ncbi:MAG: heme exporter protein CcmB [Chloroflexales bacterium]